MCSWRRTQMRCGRRRIKVRTFPLLRSSWLWRWRQSWFLRGVCDSRCLICSRSCVSAYGSGTIFLSFGSAQSHDLGWRRGAAWQQTAAPSGTLSKIFSTSLCSFLVNRFTDWLTKPAHCSSAEFLGSFGWDAAEVSLLQRPSRHHPGYDARRQEQLQQHVEDAAISWSERGWGVLSGRGPPRSHPVCAPTSLPAQWRCQQPGGVMRLQH